MGLTDGNKCRCGHHRKHHVKYDDGRTFEYWTSTYGSRFKCNFPGCRDPWACNLSVHKLGVNLAPRNLEIVRMRRQKKTYREIGERFNLTKTSCSVIYERHVRRENHRNLLPAWRALNNICKILVKSQRATGIAPHYIQTVEEGRGNGI